MTRTPAVLAALVLCAFAIQSAAQNAPPPPTPYPSPVTGYAGRYVDSSQTVSYQYFGPNAPRTYRADIVKAAPERDMLYMIVGSTFVGQTLSTFADRAATIPRQMIHRSIPPGNGETYLSFEKWTDADRSGWWTQFVDQQNMLIDFDWDDRGFAYLAYSAYGFGIIDEDFHLVHQVDPSGASMGPRRIVVFRDGARYYGLVSDESISRLWDLTVPTTPTMADVFSPDRPGIRDWAKATDGHLALLLAAGGLQIHTPATLIAKAAPVYAPAGKFLAVTTDGTNFYALQQDRTSVHVFQPAGDTYTDTAVSINLPFFNTPVSIDYGAGYLAISGSRIGAIYRVDGASLTLLDGTYFQNWLNDLANSGFIYAAAPRTLLPVFDGSRTILVAANSGLGDVFTMTSPPPLTVAASFSPSSIAPAGTSLFTLTITNPNSVPVSFALDETLPPGVVSTGASQQTTCGAATLTAPAQSSAFQLEHATVPASSSCTLALQVTSTVPGTHTFTVDAGAIVSADNTNSEAGADLLVLLMDPPQVAKSFSAPVASPGTPVRMTITLTNPNTLAITGAAFTDNYPAALINATPANVLNTCGGTVLASNGGMSLALSGGTIPASGSCTVSVDVTATQAVTVSNTIPAGAVTSDNAEPSASAATAILSAASIAGVPTLSEWAMLAMIALLGLAAVLRTRL